ncbi:endodeoxyribonuclease RusA family protein [Candidatus Termititenax aidoneus]|uniref:Endodeoxyribonuclease RusA family protein n=1 Tax=Termititenax aidoneus TaxID=2218524 RepID=A0A388TB26_TERA1|nr:endodeoxyribonuclease RusA family protein [Candidatus Termititenax aidoneus]
MKIDLIIRGNPPSKSNSYKIITIYGHGSLGKTPALKKYERDFELQVPATYKNQLTAYKWCRIYLAVYFDNNRQDLDNSAKIILDCLQKNEVIKNDRAVKFLSMEKRFDKINPRVEIQIEGIDE